MTMKVRSLFSGVGGIDLGLERAGMEVISQCEREPYRRQILSRHWPDVEVTDDVTEVSYEHGTADLLCGGFPCQDLSVAGRRKGLDGARSGLFFEFARIADECVPEGGWILIENVPGLLSSKSGRDFGVILSTLADLGFHDIAWRILDSRYFGVPQRRRRVFILARRSVGQRAAKVLLEPEGDGGHPQEGRKKGSKRPLPAEGSAGARGGAALAGGSQGEANGRPLTIGFDSNPALDKPQEGTSPPLKVNLNGQRTGSGPNANVAIFGVLGDKSHALTSEGMDASEDGTGRGTPIIASALDRMRGGADDNDAQANHIIPAGPISFHTSGYGAQVSGDAVATLQASDARLSNQINGVIQPVGLGKDTSISGTLGKKGVGGGGLGLDREGAMVVEGVDHLNGSQTGDVSHTIPAGAGESGNRMPMVVLVAPEVAAPLTRGHATGDGVSVPGRRMEDDKNIVAFNLRGREGGAQAEVDDEGLASIRAANGGSSRSYVVFGAWNPWDYQDLGGADPVDVGSLLGGSRGSQYSLNNMPLVAKCLNGRDRTGEDVQDYVVESALFNPYRTSLGKGEGYVEGWKPDDTHDAVTAQDPPKGRPVAVGRFRAVEDGASVTENQRAEVREGRATFSLTNGGGKPGQGYPAARVIARDSVKNGATGTLAGIDKGNHNRWFDIMMPAGLVRRLTPTECERLQGFPDGWTCLPSDEDSLASLAGESSWYEVGVIKSEEGSVILVPRVSDPSYLDRMLASMIGGIEVDEPKPDGRRYAAMGDAVTVPVAHWIGARLLEYGAD